MYAVGPAPSEPVKPDPVARQMHRWLSLATLGVWLPVWAWAEVSGWIRTRRYVRDMEQYQRELHDWIVTDQARQDEEWRQSQVPPWMRRSHVPQRPYGRHAR